MSYSKKDQALNNIYGHLRRCNGVLVKWDDKVTCKYKDFQGKELILEFREPPSSDISVIDQWASEKEYAPLIDMVKDEPLKNIIDAGANIGMASLLFCVQYPGVRVLSIEPDTSNAEVLTRNMQHNGFAASNKVLKNGLWSSSGYLEISDDFRDGKEWSLSVKKTDRETDLKGIALHEIMENESWDQIDLLKIDIEGSEAEIFFNYDHIQTVLAKTKFMVMELHYELDIKERFEEVLQANNFEYTDINNLYFAKNKNLVK